MVQNEIFNLGWQLGEGKENYDFPNRYIELVNVGPRDSLMEGKPRQKTNSFPEYKAWEWGQSLHPVEQYDYKKCAKGLKYRLVPKCIY